MADILTNLGWLIPGWLLLGCILYYAIPVALALIGTVLMLAFINSLIEGSN